MTKQNWMHLAFHSEAMEAIVKWWEELQDSGHGDRAHLRRCSGPGEILLEPAYYRLQRRIARYGKAQPMRMAFVAGLLSHAKVNTGDSAPGLPESMRRPQGGGTSPRVSDMRFRRLLKLDRDTEPDLFYSAFMRAIRLLDGQARLRDLVRDVYYWNESVKQDWAFRYYTSLQEE